MSADPARMAAMSDPARNKHFSRRWLDPQGPWRVKFTADAANCPRIRASSDPAVLRAHSSNLSGGDVRRFAQISPNLGTWPSWRVAS